MDDNADIRILVTGGSGFIGTNTIDYLIENKEIHALSSHHIKMPMPEIDGVNIFPILLFRNPIERVGSVYQFERKQDAETPGAVNAKKYSLSDYVKWRMEKTSGATIREFHTRYCVGKITRPGLDLTDIDFQEAKKVVNENPLIGMVERFNESMVWMEESMRPYFSSLDLSCVSQNINQSTSRTTDEKIDKFFSQLDSESADLLLENNKYDILLFNYVRSVLAKRIESIEDLESKLEKFNLRCQKLSYLDK